jgi:hypothetical protein
MCTYLNHLLTFLSVPSVLCPSESVPELLGTKRIAAIDEYDSDDEGNAQWDSEDEENDEMQADSAWCPPWIAAAHLDQIKKCFDLRYFANAHLHRFANGDVRLELGASRFHWSEYNCVSSIEINAVHLIVDPQYDFDGNVPLRWTPSTNPSAAAHGVHLCSALSASRMVSQQRTSARDSRLGDDRRSFSVMPCRFAYAGCDRLQDHSAACSLARLPPSPDDTHSVWRPRLRLRHGERAA